MMRELARMLEQEGGSLADVVRVDVHLTDLKQINALDSIYAEFLSQGATQRALVLNHPTFAAAVR